jgi:monofunctional biosynthetic peptidoglycan transglycosylase
MLFMSLLLAAAALVLAIVALRWLPPPTSSYMLQSPVKPVQYRWVPAGDIADTARRAVVAAEDQKFWTHHGFDMEAIEQAQQYNSNPHHHRRGASTISQQTAKNLFLWPGGYVRKGIEAGLTVLIEKLWGKNRILDVYLNIAEFGPGIYGVEAASQSFFGKPASRLSAEEAARLAAGPYVQARTAWILGQMGYPSPGTPQEEPEPPAAGTPEALPDGGDRDEALPEPAPRAEPGQGGAEAPAAEAPPPAADKPPG